MRDFANIAVVIPALNEAASIGKVIGEIPEWVDDIVVGDNGSTDGTAEVARAAGARVIVAKQRGYGTACLAAMATLASPDIVVFLDGDYSDYPAEMERLVDPLIAGRADLVIGSRVLGDAAPGALTVQQRFGNWLACRLIRFFWDVAFTDLGPFRAIRWSALRQLDMCDPNYGWTVEMQVKAAQQRLRALEVPVSYRRRIGKSKVSGTIRGVWGAGTKILGTIISAARRPPPDVPVKDDHARVIVFTRYPEAGKSKTRLAPTLGEAGAAELHGEMLSRTLAWANELRERGTAQVEVCYAGGDRLRMRERFGDALPLAPQADGDLGERMRRAARDAFVSGVRSVVLVGTDCPELEADRVGRALTALARHDVVLGPAHDGGYYLLGLRRVVPELFADMPWGSANVLTETLRRCEALGLAVARLETLHDVDRPEDLAVWERIAARRGEGGQ